MNSDRAILLVNMGSVSAPTSDAVRAFLAEFLSDPHVLKLPRWKRWALLNLIILRFRPKKIAPHYAAIWNGEMSPLLADTVALQHALQARVGDEAHVVAAMRYGEPSIEEAVRKLKRLRIRQLAIFPLYPQYAEATTLSALRAVGRAVAREKLFFQSVYQLPSFFVATGYLDALCARARPYLAKPFDACVVSFHSLPVSRAAERYEEQCRSTADSFCKRAGIPPEKLRVCFQSRFGRGEWLGPDTLLTLEQLANQGKQSVVVLCPSFVAEGLESLYEMGVEARRVFLENGGTDFRLVPALGDAPEWVDFLAKQSESAWREQANVIG